MSQQEICERRQFYRVSDRALVDIRPMENLEINPESCFDLNPSFSILNEFHQLDIESKQLLRQITDNDKNLGLYLKTLNSKLDALARGIALNNEPLDESKLKDINLSEGGFSTPLAKPLPADAAVAIKLILIPSFTGVIAKGTVINCETEGDKSIVHIAFSGLDNTNQQLIARHIIRKQSRERQILAMP